MAAGIVVVLANWASMIATIVLPRGRTRAQRLTWSLTWAVHRVAVAVSRLSADYARRDALLAAVAPAAVVVQLVSFLGLFIVGYALMLLPWSQQLGAAFDQAGAGAVTLGLARAAGHTNDAIVVLAAASGAITVALQIGYLPVLYQSFARRETLVALMESRAGVPAWGPEVLIRHQLVHTTDALGDFYKAWELWAADVAESHSTHPVLLLFRSPVAGYSWLLSLLAVLDAAAIQLAVNPASAPSEARLCLRMGFSALRRIAQTLNIAYNDDPRPDDPIALSPAEFADALGQLERIGFPLERTAAEAWPHFAGWRVNYEQIAYRLADAIVAPQAPWSGMRRHLRVETVLPRRPPHRSPDGAVVADDAARAGSWPPPSSREIASKG